MATSSAHPLAALYEQAEEAMREVRTPLGAELWAAELLGMVRLAIPDDTSPAEIDAALGSFAAELTTLAAQAGDPIALAMLRALAVVARPPAGAGVDRAARRLAMSGVQDPAWAATLGAPLLGACYRYGDFAGNQESVVASFWYGSTAHALVVLIDHRMGGGIKDCWAADEPDRIRDQVEGLAAEDGMFVEDLTWSRARALLREALSRPDCPEQDDQVQDVALSRGLLLARLELEDDTAVHAGVSLRTATGRPVTSATAARARTSPSRAPRRRQVLVLKVTLKGSKPPIWRRLEVPDDVTLDELSDIIQVAFDWAGYHLYLFETPKGSYGDVELDIDVTSDAGVRLTSVAAVGQRLTYTYDFGDDWQHRIEVEKRTPAVDGVTYPRCTAGRRAAPPEDCGGIWSYQELLAMAADPDGAEVQDADGAPMLPEDFDPAVVELKEINDVLAGRVDPGP
jgi:hypothetical protein